MKGNSQLRIKKNSGVFVIFFCFVFFLFCFVLFCFSLLFLVSFPSNFELCFSFFSYMAKAQKSCFFFFNFSFVFITSFSWPRICLRRIIKEHRTEPHWKIGHAYPSVPSVWSLWEQWFTFLYIEATSFDCQKVQWKQKTLTPLQLLLPLSCLCCSSAAFWSRFLREKIDERCDDGFP